MSDFRTIDCECGNSYQAEETRSFLECPKCKQAKMVFRRPSVEKMIEKWQGILDCSKSEASATIVEMMAQIVEAVEEKDS